MIFLFFLLSLFKYSADEVLIEIKNNTRIIKAHKNVYVKGEDFEIFADSAVLFENEDIDSSYLFGNIIIKTPKMRINSNKVFYNFIERRGTFEKNVKIETDTFEIFSQKVFYDEKRDSAFTHKRVLIFDKVNNMEIHGYRMVYHPRIKEGKIDSLLFIKIKRKEDTLIIKGKNLVFLKGKIIIEKDVEIKGEELKGGCKLFEFEKDLIFLKGEKSFLETENSYLEGDTLKIELKEGKMRKVSSIGNSFLKSISEKKDTLFLFANFLNIIFDDSLKPVKIYGFEGIHGEVKR